VRASKSYGVNNPIRDIFLNYIRRANQNEKLCVYIDYPFCQRKCSYCIYESIPQPKSHDAIEAYEKALLFELLEYRALFMERRPDCLYFGGGTPSLRERAAISRIVESIPDYDSIPSIKVELHPRDMNDDLIGYYAKVLRPHIVSLGVQSLDRESCCRQNRDYCPPSSIARIVSRFHDYGIWVNVDLIALLASDSEAAWAVFRRDLEIMRDMVKPDVITCLPNYLTLLDYPSQVLHLRRILSEICDESYVPASRKMLSLDMADILQYGRNDHWIATPDYWRFYAQDHRYSCSGPKTGGTSNQITIAFGGYGKHRVYSYLPDKSFVAYSSYDPQIGAFDYKIQQLER